MRKPLVVGVAALALLLAGGIAAVPAGAEETPDVPGRPGFAMPHRPGSRQAPAEAGTLRRRATVDRHRTDARPGHRLAEAPRRGRSRSARAAVTAADVPARRHGRVQRQVLWMINQYRRRGGCGALHVDRRLITAANGHAADMARRRCFAHRSPNGEGAGDRVSGAGYRWRRYGENIARGVHSPYEVVRGWMHSRAHRENIMDCRLHEVGLGLAISGRTPYWVQDFATGMK